ncbi:MAG: EAL domain-containing protein [Actinomycetota bacterium]|nr:EAL domain-containing protein [Actinomycetota bacterium]
MLTGAVMLSARVVKARANAAQRATSRLVRAQDLSRRARQRGRGQCEVAAEDMGTGRQWLVDEEGALRRALAEGRLRLHYQPKVCLESGDVTGAEALLRWDDPDRGLIPPLEFIALAEKTGLIVPIGNWVIEEACREAAQWHGRFPRRPPLVVSVNVSARQFGPELIDVVAGALAATGTDPHQLCLEVTESILIGDADAAVDTMHRLAALGVRLSIDDFGTGYSSLSNLKRLPLHELKIDRSFVAGVGEDSDDTAIVAATVAMAHALGLSVVAEGVETADQLDGLRVLGCQEVQGYFISRPQPAEAFAQLLAGWHSKAGGALGRPGGLHRPQRILVVDDTEDVRQMARMSLVAAGFEVDEVATGAEAVGAARRTLPDCVLLDVAMPHMSGFDVCSALRADPATAGCTIVMLTSNAASDDKVEAFSCGADDYMIKPFSPRDLVGRVRAAMRRRSDGDRHPELSSENAELG